MKDDLVVRPGRETGPRDYWRNKPRGPWRFEPDPVDELAGSGFRFRGRSEEGFVSSPGLAELADVVGTKTSVGDHDTPTQRRISRDAINSAVAVAVSIIVGLVLSRSSREAWTGAVAISALVVFLMVVIAIRDTRAK